ncbi:hypothetical protein H4582DRAFT_2057992 [Lactarius indigo]|nr:hypothetical protein H4582DRAFT_2057992 [Lactarius indigo]
MRKPSAANAAAGTAGSARGESQLVRSHGGDSAHEGDIGIRGVVLAWHGRSGGVAIMGAAEKRTWEEGKVDTEDSAAKRLLLTVTRTACCPGPQFVGILSRDKTSSFQSGGTRNAPNQLQKQTGRTAKLSRAVLHSLNCKYKVPKFVTFLVSGWVV